MFFVTIYFFTECSTEITTNIIITDIVTTVTTPVHIKKCNISLQFVF